MYLFCFFQSAACGLFGRLFFLFRSDFNFGCLPFLPDQTVLPRARFFSPLVIISSFAIYHEFFVLILPFTILFYTIRLGDVIPIVAAKFLARLSLKGNLRRGTGLPPIFVSPPARV